MPIVNGIDIQWTKHGMDRASQRLRDHVEMPWERIAAKAVKLKEGEKANVRSSACDVVITKRTGNCCVIVTVIDRRSRKRRAKALRRAEKLPSIEWIWTDERNQ